MIYEQIVVKLSILLQSISDSDDVEVIEVMSKCSQLYGNNCGGVSKIDFK